MTRADTMLTNGTIATIDPTYAITRNGAVAVQSNEIIAIGPTTELEQLYEAAEVVDCTGLTLLPGLINAHTHAPMTLLRGLADDLRLDVWLMGYMMPTEREFVSPEFCRLGTALAC